MAQPIYRIQMMNPGKWEPIRYFEESVSVEWSRKVNDLGETKITVPDNFPVTGLPRNMRILIWRERDGHTTLAGKTIWVTRRLQQDLEKGLITFMAKDANILIDNRVVAYTPYTTEADKTTEEFEWEFGAGTLPPVSDDMIKEFVNENMGNAPIIDPDRNLVSSGRLTIEADQSLGVFVEKTASFQNLLSTIQDVANQSKDAGTPIFFDMVPNPIDGTFLFRTWVNFRGRDRGSTSDNPLVFSQDLENLTKPTLEFDYVPEYNFLYFTGIGSGAGLWVEEYENIASTRNDPYGRREFVREDTNRDNEDNQMDNIARGWLEGATAKLTLRAEVVDTPLARYGVDYDFGDIVSAQVGGYKFDCFVTAVSANFKDGEEKISIKLESTVPLLT